MILSKNIEAKNITAINDVGITFFSLKIRTSPKKIRL